ncbi:MAG: hypothetical protein IPP96_17125 [Chitinophagaceae bacterium]|nr:hypothetical protein [Chitinophagaceae bacterium]
MSNKFLLHCIKLQKFDHFRARRISPNGQGLLQGWNSLLVRPEPLLIKDIKVQVNKQKPSNVCPAQMKHNSDKMTIAPTSSQPCSKPYVSGCFASMLVQSMLWYHVDALDKK